jgi:hypothetical protein
VVGEDFRWVVRTVAAVEGLAPMTTGIRSDDAIRDAENAARRGPVALIVAPGPDVRLHDLHPLLTVVDRTRFILVVGSLPPPNGFRELVTECGGAVCAIEQSRVHLVATVIAVLAAHVAV